MNTIDFNQDKVSSSKIWLSSPHMGGAEIEYIKKAVDLNEVSSFGENIEFFEQSLSIFLSEGKNEIALLNSATSALHIGLILLGVGHNDEVLVQTHTYVASVNPVIYQGATAIFVDSESETGNICPEALEKAIIDRIKRGQKPKAIIAVHLYGMPYKVDEIRHIADKYQIPILEDSAEALGSLYKGNKCGTFGDIGVLSFNGNKIITTSGGGAIITKDKKQKARAVFLSTQARDKAPHYQHSEIGYNYRMSNISAGIGCGQMQVLNKHIALRRKMHDFYISIFSGIEGVTVLREPNENFFSNHWLTVIIIDPSKTKNDKSREGLRLFLESLNIESRPLWKPMHLQPAFEKFPYYGNNIAEGLFEKGLCLPSGSNLTDEDRNRLKSAIRKFF